MINYDQQGSEHSGITFDDKQLAMEYCEWKKREGYRVKLVQKGSKYIVYMYENGENGELINSGDLSRKIEEED